MYRTHDNDLGLLYVKNQDKYTFNLDEVRDPNVKYPNQKKNGKIKVNLKGKNPTDVWQFPKVTSGKNRASKERTPHPAQFPVAVVDRIIKSASKVNDIVLDPFMGSGTTAIVALGLQRQVIGFEIRADYCEIVANRIDDFLRNQELTEAQLSLF
ncbi:site-specific DNA-methyltransferase [Microcoleus sp. Pol11C2]|uniref:site-specific DNA-methyltransferase n=1 Tax=Microcoleus sp. Pol11C2 TaxID=3055389 RepID=UPI002FD69177